MYVCMYVSMKYVCRYVYIHMCIYIYTHIGLMHANYMLSISCRQYSTAVVAAASPPPPPPPPPPTASAPAPAAACRNTSTVTPLSVAFGRVSFAVMVAVSRACLEEAFRFLMSDSDWPGVAKLPAPWGEATFWNGLVALPMAGINQW